MDLKQCNLSYENRFVVANQILTMINGFAMDEKLSGEKLRRLKKEFFAFLGRNSRGNDEIKVSVIIPVYNGEKYLRRTLDCLTFQSLYEIEIICVNDCSDDDSITVLREYQKNVSKF